MRRMTLLSIGAATLLVAGCTEDIGQNVQTSDCGGFDASPAREDDGIPCGDERLEWEYDSASGVLTLMHRDRHFTHLPQLATIELP